MNYGNAKAPVKRMPIPIEDIHKVQKLCFELDDDIRWIIAAVSDSGMWLAEVIGLTTGDIHLDEEVLCQTFRASVAASEDRRERT